MSKVKTEIEWEICSQFNGTKIPEKLTIDINKNVATIELDGKMVVEDNMQVVGNAFEGWAIVTHICSKKDVVLSVRDHSYFPKGYIGHGHFCRFVYRIMKFADQYSWFRVEDDLKEEISKFKTFLSNNVLINNIPTKEAEETERINDENSIEAKLAENGILKAVLDNNPNIGEGPVYRQLPVGLFCGEKSKYTSVFTYGHSAIDLWNRDGETINVVELKYKNNMIGIITELFFYSNYMLDLIDEDGFFNLANGKNIRGYDELKKGLKCVNGIMLADSYHPCVDKRSLEELNKNGKKGKLMYYQAEYRADITVDVTKIEKV